MNELPKKCDVVVLGGGPSGSSAAGFLAQQGYDVVLLEKLKHPRAVVGESLIPHFWKYADLLGVSDAIDAANFVAKSGAVHSWNGVSRKMNFKPFGYSKSALHVERAEFDHILLKNTARLGATVSEQTQVRRVKLGDGSAEVFYSHNGEEGSIKARYVVDSTGQAAFVSRQEGTRIFDNNFRYTAMWAYFTGGYFTNFDGERHPASDWQKHPPVTYVASIGDTGHSWLWHIVLRNKTSVGLVLSRDYVEELKKANKSVKEEFFRLVNSTPLFNELMEGSEYIEDSFAAIRDYAYAAKEFVIGDNCFVTGDGAAFVDPINSVGVPFSMFTGYLASWCIDQTLKGTKNDAIRIYKQQLKNRVSVYKLLALPPHLEDPSEDEMNLVRLALKQERALEQELILVQSQLTSRSERIMSFYEQEGIPTESDKIHIWNKQW